MSKDLTVQQFSCEPEHFFAGVDIPVAKATKTAAEAIAAHALVVIDSDTGKVKNVTATTTGTGENKKTTVSVEGLYGIAAGAVAADEPVVIYLTGEVFADALALGEGVSADHVEIPLRNLGIFLK